MTTRNPYLPLDGQWLGKVPGATMTPSPYEQRPTMQPVSTTMPVKQGSSAGVGGALKTGLSVGSMLLGSPLVGLGVQGLFSWLGNRSQNKANERATSAQQQANAAQMALAQRQFDAEQENTRLDRMDADRRWQAEQANLARQLAAEDEERAFTRSITEAAEARKAARNQVAQRAQMTLMQLLGMR